MDIKKYVPKDKIGQDLPLIAKALEVGASRAILRAVKIKRDEGRVEVETKPQSGRGDMRRNVEFKLGEIKALNWVLSLPEVARAVFDQLPEDGL